MRLSGVLGGIVMFHAAAAQPEGVPACALHHTVTATARSVAELPVALRRDLLSHLRAASDGEGDDARALIAAPEAPFNATDVGGVGRPNQPPLPHRRFLRAGLVGGTWFIWYEHGGRGYHAHLVLYAAPRQDAPAMLLANFSLAASDLCAATDAALEHAAMPVSAVSSKTHW